MVSKNIGHLIVWQYLSGLEDFLDLLEAFLFNNKNILEINY